MDVIRSDHVIRLMEIPDTLMSDPLPHARL